MFLSLIRGKQDIRTTRKTAQGTAVTDSYLCAEVVSIPVPETWTKWHVDNYYMCNVFPCFSVAQCCRTLRALRQGSDADIFIQTYAPVDDISAWASLLIDM